MMMKSKLLLYRNLKSNIAKNQRFHRNHLRLRHLALAKILPPRACETKNLLNPLSSSMLNFDFVLLDLRFN